MWERFLRRNTISVGGLGASVRALLGGLTLALLAAVAPREVHAQAMLPTGFTETRIEGISAATALELAPDGRAFVCEQRGNVRVIKNGVLLPDPFLTVDVQSYQERGLIGIQFDPDFAANRRVYVYYTALAPTFHNRLSRFTADGDVTVPGSEVVLLDLPTLGESGWHNGGSMVFGPDGKLYVGVGENNVPSNAQSLSTPLGKVLRINPDGSIPSDNPYFDSTTGLGRAIWALGFRNPYTLTFQPGTARLFANDVGGSAFEEINEVKRGRNYGWPIFEGESTDPNFGTPVYAYPHPTTSPFSSAITGGAFYNPTTNQFPREYLGKYLFMDGFTQVINVLDTDSRVVTPFATFPVINDSPDVVPLYLKVASDGSLYYLARGRHSLNRIQYTGVLTPQIGTQPADQLVSVGLPAAFSVSAFGATPLFYQWERKDAGAANFTPVPGAVTPTLTLTTTSLVDDGAQFRCALNNSVGRANTVAATLSITTNQPPLATIDLPTGGTLYRAGDTIQFSGTGTDPETGLLTEESMTWSVDFQHLEHNHPFISELSGVSSGSFVIPAVGETSDQVRYRIYLTVTDPVGLKHTTYRDIFPVKARVTLATVPPGLQLTLDGTPITGPFSFVGVAGILREISAGHQVLGGVIYEFTGWSDGGNSTHVIRTPPAVVTLTANFRPVVNAIDNAAFVSQSTESFMVAGQTYNVSVTMKNIGTTTWNSESAYFLSSQNPPDSTNWNVIRVPLPNDVLPGVVTTLNFAVIAPELPGTYAMQWQMIHDGVALFGAPTTLEPISVTLAGNAARFIGQTVPTNMIAGETYPVVIQMKNVGSASWRPDLKYRLTNVNPLDNTNFGVARVSVPDVAPPGNVVVFSFPLVAPLTPGTYNFQWRMGQEAGATIGRFGDVTDNVPITVTPLANDALFVSQNVPATMLPNQTYTVSVAMRNIGTNTWTSAANYRLGSQNPLDNSRWGLARVLLGADVPPGQVGVFNFTVLAPNAPGNYSFQWQMLREGVAFFGSLTDNQVVQVAAVGEDAQFVLPEIFPPSVVPGQTYNVSITFRNTGASTWNPETHRLIAINPTGNTTWGVGSFSLTGPVAPGESAVFAGVITAPATLGDTLFQWQMISAASGLFGAVTPNILINVVPRPNNAAFVSQNVPAQMVPGQGYDVQIVFQNTGSNPWTSAGLYNLAVQNPLDNTNWGSLRVVLPASVEAGGTATFNFRIQAPTVPGTYNFQWRMVQEAIELFGDFTRNVAVVVGTASSDAVFVANSAPLTVNAGSVFNASVTVRNTGATTWTSAGGFVLGTQNPSANQTWGLNRVALSAPVAPGGQVTFNVPLTAPAVPATYNLQWQMFSDAVGYFGQLSENLAIIVSERTIVANDAIFGSQTVPTVMDPNKIYVVSLTMTNTGTTAWTGSQLYRLGSQNPANNLTWSVNRIGLPTTAILPGATATFDFQVLSPTAAGVYDFQWQMVQDGVGFFGVRSPTVRVTVGNPGEQAAFVGQEVPAGLNIEQPFTATVSFRNVGGQTWTPEAGYQLGSLDGADHPIFGTNRASLSGPVPPGEIATFTFVLNAPSVVGAYNFQWRMLRDGVGFFGETGTNSVINVSLPSGAANDAAFVSQNIPETMVSGLTYPISITISNSGTQGWTRERLYRLASFGPIDNLIFNVNRVLLPAPTPAGGVVTFTFNIAAPVVPGTYACQWRMVQEAVAFFGVPTPSVRVTILPQGNSAVFVSQAVPAVVTTGQVFTATVTMRNTGGSTWTPEDLIRLRTENPADNLTWGINRVLLPGPVAPGAAVTFTTQLVAPNSPGSYNLEWGMVKEATGPFGQLTPNTAINVIAPTQAPLDAAFVSQNVPTAMTPGQIYIASITMANTGATPWTTDRLFRLGAQNPANNLTWSVNRVGLPSNIAAGATATFDFQVLAPTTPGAYNFQWQMVLDGDAGFFGSQSSNLVIIVGEPGDNADFVRQLVPITVTNGQTFNVTVTMRNSGGTAWVGDGGYQLGSQSPADNLNWSFNRTPLPGVVAPGQTVDFNFQLTAPAASGTYDFQWQMVRAVVGYFGQPSAKLAVTVAPAAPPVDAATYGAQSVPARMAPGQSYPVSVTLTNTGNTTWSNEGLYRLASQNPTDNLTWGINRVALPASVSPGGVVQFDFTVTAPTAPGTYKYQWQMVREGVAYFGDSTPAVDVRVSGQLNAAAFVSQNVPAVMNKGQRYPVSITLRNVGDSIWTRDAGFRLGAQNPLDNLLFGVNRVGVTTPVIPGGTFTFSFLVSPPDDGGIHNFQWQMVKEGTGFFGERTPSVPVSVITASGLGNQAAFIAQSVPANLVAGATVPVAITLRNNGTNTWTAEDRYRLGSQNPGDTSVWNLNRVELPNAVLPGGIVTINFNIRAPRVAGNYNFQWQMLQEAVGWFGQTTPNVVITVGALSPPLIVTSPTNRIVNLGQTATFTVVATGAAPLAYQWLRSSKPITGATASTYTIFQTTAGDDGAQFRCVVTNSVGTAISSTAVLSVADVAAPAVTGQSPEPNSTIALLNTSVRAVFSQAMDPGSINNATFRLVVDGSTAALPALVNYDAATRTASLIPLQNLNPGVLYTARLTGGAGGVSGLAGVPLPADVVWTFTTLDSRPLTVTSVTPTTGARQVAVDSPVRLTFNRSVDPTSLNSTTLTVLRKGSTTPVPGIVTYDAATRTATFTPTVNMQRDWTYIVTALGGAQGIRDNTGLVMASSFVSQFYTTDTQPPRFSNVAASGVTATTAIITWNTNENADTQVAYGLTAALGTVTAVNPALALTHSVNLTGLTPNTTYHFQVRSRDGFNNAGASTTDFTFTTTP